MARNSEFQAILPIRGKIINVEKARLTRVLQNNEIQALITAIGAGVGDDFDVEKCRYHKVIVLADADLPLAVAEAAPAEAAGPERSGPQALTAYSRTRGFSTRMDASKISNPMRLPSWS